MVLRHDRSAVFGVLLGNNRTLPRDWPRWFYRTVLVPGGGILGQQDYCRSSHAHHRICNREPVAAHSDPRSIGIAHLALGTYIHLPPQHVPAHALLGTIARYACRLHNFVEDRRLVNGKLGERLAIESDVLCLQSGNKTTVGNSSFAHRGIQTRNPQCSKEPLLATPIAVGVLTGLHHGLVRLDEGCPVHAAKSLGKLADF